jgi:hypothetical protein
MDRPTSYKSGITGNTSTAAAQECLRPLLPSPPWRPIEEQERQRTPSEDRYRNTNKLKDRYYRHSQQEWIFPMVIGTSKPSGKCNASPNDRSLELQILLPTAATKKSLSPHERNPTRVRGNGPDRKKSTLLPLQQCRRDTVSRNCNNHCPQQPIRGQPTVPESQHPTHADSTVRWRGAAAIIIIERYDQRT